MKRIAIVSFALLCTTLLIPLAITWTREPMPVVGSSLPTDYQPHPHGALASSTALYPTYVSPGGKYRVGVDTANIVRLVISTHGNFETPDRISTSSTLSDVRSISRLPVQSDGKFGYTVKLPSGWVARFDPADGPPHADSQVASVFAR